MTRSLCLLSSVVLLFGLHQQSALAQFGTGLPRVGTRLPNVTVYDQDGREFSLTELRGQYTVLVFGCLT